LRVHGYDSPTHSYNQDQQAKIKEILEFYEEKLPKATAHRRVLLKILTGELFKAKLYQYARNLLVKGVPPLIVDLKDCYSDPERV
jgi:peptide alpha-N-acetyltransferase